MRDSTIIIDQSLFEKNKHQVKKPVEQAPVFDIQKFSVHDGPGIRTLIFMKGCPLRCRWCSNPESQNYHPEVALSESRCIGCGRCEDICPTDAIIPLADGKIRIERSRCNNCGKCAEVCPAKAIRLFGEYMSIHDVLRVVEEDSPFYWRSGGGITVSGGEPLLQAQFVNELLKECRHCGIDIAVEICGHAAWEDVRKVCTYADLIFYDIKHMDPSKHKAFTGVSNELILGNIERISKHFREIPIIVRTPIVPGFTDSEANIEDIVDFLKCVESLKKYELLSYHGFGEAKYNQLGRAYELSGLQPPSQEHMAKLIEIAQKAN